MTIAFDPGYAAEPFRSLCREYPGASVYPPSDFRVEWGPVFHRGRLDGTARVLVIGQDPATAETVTRRILVGAAGQRLQGLLLRLGLTRSYVLVNTFLYSVYGQAGGERHADDAGIAAYRELWLDALLGDEVEAVISLGALADRAWTRYRTRVGGRAGTVAYAHLRHPTWPESSAGGSASRLAEATAALLADWNRGLAVLSPAIQHPDEQRPLKPYGTTWQAGDLVAIPPEDLPPGLPEWMRSPSAWVSRAGKSAAEKRATLVVKVPDGVIPARATRIERLAVPAAADAHAQRDDAQRAPPEEPDDRVDALASLVHGERGARVLALAQRRYGLRGRVVTMAGGKPLADAVVWIDGGTIAAIQKKGEQAPPAFAGLTPLDTQGVIYPGFMDLHNHLAYDVLSLWQVPAAYRNREQWKDEPTYDQLVKRPMKLLAAQPGALAAICRYVECKALFGGVTTTQGIRLASANDIRSYYRGLVRNVELPGDRSLPRGESRMPDIEAKDAARFRRELEGFDRRGAAFLLHVAEGWDDAARQRFLALRTDTAWAIDRALAGIHCVGLGPDDFEVLAENDGSMVWSPYSNLLLYGQTAHVQDAKRAGVRIGLGCDWSPSGSKNLLHELKVAWLYSRSAGEPFDAEALVRMVTSVAAAIVRWDGHLGTIEERKLADLTVLASRRADAYQNAVLATEADVRLVVIGGVPRYGHPDLMHELVTPDRDVEDLLVAGEPRTIDLEDTDPDVSRMRFTEAQALLAAALSRLPELEKARAPSPLAALRSARSATPGLRLSLDEIEDTGEAMRTSFGKPTHRGAPARAAKKLPTVAVPLDPATLADDPAYWEALALERNLPGFLKAGLPPLYGVPAPAPAPMAQRRHAIGQRGRYAPRGGGVHAR